MMNRRIAYLRNLLWTVRFGHPHAVEWPWYLRIFPVALLLANETFFAWWTFTQASYTGNLSVIIHSAILFVLGVYIYPLLAIDMFRRW